MPTDKPRLNVTFDPYTYALLDRIRELSGTPMSRLVSEILQEVRPTLEGMVRAMEEFQAASREVQLERIKALEEAGERLMPDVRRLQAQTQRVFDKAAGKE